jgi:hypothetical protein
MATSEYQPASTKKTKLATARLKAGEPFDVKNAAKTLA